MERQNKYLGDDKFKKFLEHYECSTPLDVVKMKFAGALCSPNLNLRPTDVISSFWEQGKLPRLETKEEADLFFKFFMGLWDEIFEQIKNNSLKISPRLKEKSDEAELINMCQLRYEELELGFVEGFWGGQNDLKLPAFLAEIIDSLSQMSEVYATLIKKLESNTNISDVRKMFLATDKMAEKAIAFIIENSVLPRIENLQRTVN